MNDTNKERARPKIDANDLEAMAKARPDECFLKGSGILKLTSAIRKLEREARAAKAPAAEPTGWYALAADGMATLCVDRDDAEKTAADSEKKWPNCGPFRAVQLYTAPPAPTEQWRDIETAPRDGTEVLLWREDCGQFIGRYTSCDAFPLTQDEIDATDEETLFAKDWFTQWPQALRLEGSEVPTQWRHLPDDPAPPQGAAKGAT